MILLQADEEKTQNIDTWVNETTYSDCGAQIMKAGLAPNVVHGPGELVDIRLSRNVVVNGTLFVPEGVRGLITFAHGSGFCGEETLDLALILHKHKFGTLLFDLLTPEESKFDEGTGLLRVDAIVLGDRMLAATIWVEEQRKLQSLELGIFADDAGAAAALITAARLPDIVKAVVCRSGNLLAASASLPYIKAATMLMTGSDDSTRGSNEAAFAILAAEKRLEVIPDCTTLLDRSERLIYAGEVAAKWFEIHLEAQENS